jgi:general nucleoside transport system permease protein
VSATAAPAAPAPERAVGLDDRTRLTGWGGVVLGTLAAFVPVPPLLVRSPVLPVLLGLAAVACGVLALRGGRRRLGWGAIAAGVLGAGLGVLATRAVAEELEVVFVWSALAGAMLRFATPLLFAALGGIVSERAGVVNIGLEGMMLIGAFFAVLGADKLGSWPAGLLVGMVAGGLVALIHAYFSIGLRAEQIVSGTAINLLAAGITGYVFLAVYGDLGTPNDVSRVPAYDLPVLGGQSLLTFLALLLTVALSAYLFRTPGGLRLRAVGEKPRAAATVGIDVIRTRYLGVVASGVLASLGGAFLSLSLVGSFNQGMTAGRGFIALAVVIIGKWRPGLALLAALLFGFSSALAQRLPEFSPSAATLFQALPYVLTLVAVAGIIGRSRPPASVGIPYTKE